MNWRQSFARWKYHYDLSASFLGLVNFTLLSITASGPISDFLTSRMGMSLDQYVIVGVLTLALLVGFMLFGLFLDKVLHYWQNLSSIQNMKNPEITEILNNTRQIMARQE